ncbi:IclR family transcriptional regulator [Aureimonas mangrovi]|uniref:IclR family transcriptional regulator n=1 Tax=Aureimonas mangrovi TaxID=2758041 RepID=UPI00163D72E0|nr:IclR family transcriptional regulator [Aureimonas mangrovi]
MKRALGILRMVADSEGSSVRLTDVARACELNTATAHRLLRTLAEDGFLIGAPDKTYSIGPEILRMAGRVDVGRMERSRYGGVVERIAEEVEDTVFLSIRRRSDAICVMARTGRYHIRTMSLEEGSVRPLGVGAGSLALLSSLDAGERERIVSANQARYGSFGLAPEVVLEMAEAAAKRGYSINDGRILEGVWGLGVPLRTGGASPGVAISVAAIEARMTPERMKRIVATIEEAVTQAT